MMCRPNWKTFDIRCIARFYKIARTNFCSVFSNANAFDLLLRESILIIYTGRYMDDFIFTVENLIALDKRLINIWRTIVESVPITWMPVCSFLWSGLFFSNGLIWLIVVSVNSFNIDVHPPGAIFPSILPTFEKIIQYINQLKNLQLSTVGCVYSFIPIFCAGIFF